jgi:hypothetical protein
MVLDTLPATPAQEEQQLKQVDLSEFAQHWYELRVLKRQFDEAKTTYEKYRERLGLRIGDADQIVINGKVVANHTPGAFNSSKFVKENPGVAEKYMRKRMVEEFDAERFAQENPGLHREYRTRALRPIADAE